MALTNADFIQPTGQLATSLFPGVDVPTYVDAWIAEAEDLTEVEERQRAWVYHRAYRTIADRLNADVLSASEGSVSGSRAIEQLRYFERLAARYLRAYNSAGTATVVF